MNNATKVVVAVVVVAIIGGGAFLLLKDDSKDTTKTEQNSGTSQNASGGENSGEGDTTGDVAATITYDGSTFSVSADTVTSGSKVKVVNNSQDDLDLDSNPHPVHTDNPELNVGDIAPGESRTFTLTTTGAWGFHNHLNSSQHGEITVE